MIDRKIVYGIVAIVLLLAIVYVVRKKEQKDHFGMLPSFTWKVVREAAPSMAAAEKGQFYAIPGTYQSKLAPRMSGGVDYGAYINYRLPEMKNLAVPADPLTFSNMVKENFDIDTSSCVDKLANSRSSSIAAGLARAEVDNALPDIVDEYPMASDLLPVSDMTNVGLADESQPVIYDRYIYANRNSRLRSQGDPIRGDIVPSVENAGIPLNWFRPSYNSNIDLQMGALNVIAGQNEASEALTKMIYESSGRAQTAIGGVDIKNFGNQYTTSLTAGQGDVQIAAYP